MVKERFGRIRSNLSCPTAIHSSTFRQIYVCSFASPNFILQESNLMQMTFHGTKETSGPQSFDSAKIFLSIQSKIRLY